MKKYFPLIIVLVLQWLIFNPCQAQNSSSSEAYTVVEEMPAYPGGEEARLKFLCDHIQYPKEAKENGIQGTVYVTFIISAEGEVQNIRVLRGIGGGCDEESVRVISMMPRWVPGKQDGKRVRVQFTMPIKYTLTEGGQLTEVSHSNLTLDYYLALSGSNYSDRNSPATEPKLRFTGWPNLEFNLNFRQSRHVVLYTGITFGNMGITVKDSIKHTYRYLSVGVPFGMRWIIQNEKYVLDICAGVDIPYHFKEKHFHDSGKKKSAEFFSKKVNPFQPYVCLGFGNGIFQLRFKYFPADFFNSSYSKEVNGIMVKPYKDIKSQSFEIGLVLGK